MLGHGKRSRDRRRVKFDGGTWVGRTRIRIRLADERPSQPRNECPCRSVTSSSPLAQWGPYQDMSSESSNDTVRANGLPTARTDVVTAWDVSTLTMSFSGPSTATATEHTTESSSLSNLTSTQSMSSTDRLTGPASTPARSRRQRRRPVRQPSVPASRSPEQVLSTACARPATIRLPAR